MRLQALLLLLLLPIATARAQGDIHRCMGAGGIPVFTDRACTDVNATPALPPATVATVAAPAAPGIPAAPPTVLCAADLAHLKQAVVDAFAVRNPNRLAGLMLWNGDGQDTVVANIRLFSRLMARPLVGVTVEGAPDPDESDADPAAPATVHSPAHGEALSVQTEAEDGSGATERTHFGVVHRDGCLWLEPQE